MPSEIILAATNSGTQHPSFAQRGFPQFAPGIIGDVPLFTFPRSHDPLLADALSNIASIFAAQKLGLPVFNTTKFLQKVLDDVPILPFTAPLSMFRLKHCTISTSLGAMGYEAVPGLKEIYEGRSRSLSSWRELMINGVEDTRGRPGCATVDATFAFFVSNRIVNAYVGASKILIENPQRLQFIGLEDYAKEDNRSGNAGTKFTYAKSGKTFITDEVQFPEELIGFSHIYSGQVQSCYSPLSKEKKQETVNLRKLYGTQHDEGAFFPYWHGMNMPDKDFIARMIEDHFFITLGSDLEKATQIYQAVRSGLRQLALLPSGQELAHAFFGIKISIKGQCRFFPVFHQDVYRGFYIIDNPLLLMRGKELPCVSWADINTVLTNLSQHDRSLAKMKALLGTATMPDGSEKYSTIAFNTSRQIMDVFLQVARTDFTDEDWKRINEWAGDLFFQDEVFAEPTVKNISIALEFIRSGDKKLLAPFSAHLRGGMIQRSGRVSVGFGIFGPLAPSISYGQGQASQKFEIPKEGSVDPNLEVKEGKRILEYLPYKLRPVQDAASDWDRLLTNRLLRLPEGGKKEFVTAANKTGSFNGPDFSSLYPEIKKTMEVTAISVDGKRKRADEVGEGSKTKKARKAAGENKAMGSEF